jgi:hypothetical protein
MDAISLRGTSSDATVDAIVRGVIGAFEAAFPGRVRGYYLAGSYREGDAVAGSDIDIMVVFKGRILPAEEHRARALWTACSLISPVRLDAPARSEHELLSEGHAVIKLASVCVYGEDIRDAVPLPPFDAYLRHCVTATYEYLGPILRRAPVLVAPLDYPDPAGEFFGYDRPEQPKGDGYFGGGAGGTSAFVSGLGRAAQSIVAILGHAFVDDKGECRRRYRECVGGEWANFLDELDDACKRRWGYAIPSSPTEHGELRRLCARALAFENHFLDVYRGHLVKQLTADDEPPTWISLEYSRYQIGLSESRFQQRIRAAAVRQASDDDGRLLVSNLGRILAAHVLQQIVYPQDGGVREALLRATQGDDLAVRQAANEALANLT